MVVAPPSLYFNLRRCTLVALLAEDERHDETVQTQRLGENEDEDHANKELVLLSDGAHAGVTDDTNSHTSGQAGETTTQTGREMRIPSEAGVLSSACASVGCCYGALDNHSHNQAVDTQDTSHDHGDDISHNQLWIHHTCD